MAYEEDWETGSGLALDGATVTVTDLEFGFNPNMGAGITCANFKFEDEGGEEIEQSFSVGGKFEANRDGSEITGTGKINKNSNFGLLIDSVVEVLSEQGLHPGDVIGASKAAAGWIGTKWTFGSVERETTNPTTKEKKLSTKFIVTDYHGKGDDEPVAKASSKTSTAKAGKGAAKSAAKSNGIPDGIESELWEQLVELAGESEAHEDFVNAALDLDDVASNKAAQKAVMGTKAGSVWAAKG
jgi:hypothetical protein